ncbi:MAG TPA: bacterial transcriptional activator domain-containing protein, partial [Thermoanaerobaculia bacterium]|nr:bacterial transcriptional activator domain-containing protein [Thermoanaerobaculia bacterium]
LTPRFEVAPATDIGLGFFIEERGTFGHDGSDDGFVTSFSASIDGRRGVIVMTNSDAGAPLLGEIERGVARAYGWPTAPPLRATRPVPAELLERAPGRYKQGPDRVLMIRRTAERLELRTVDGRWTPLYYLEDGTLTRTDADQRLRATATGFEIVADKPTPLPRTTEPLAAAELLAEGKVEEAVAAYRAAKADAQTLTRLGAAYQRTRRNREALALFRLATELHPDSASAWDSLATALHYTGDAAGALEATRNALATVDSDKGTDETQKYWIRVQGKSRLNELATP